MTEDIKANQTIIFGMRPVMEAIEAGKEIEKVMLRQGLEGELFRQLQDMLKKRNIPIQWVPIERLNKASKNQNHQGVVVYMSAAHYADLETVLTSIKNKGDMPFVVLLDGVTDVRNFGAIARSAECAGVQAIVMPAKGGAPLNAEAMKASAGALNRLPVCRVPNLKAAIFLLKSFDINIVGASEKADKYYFDQNFDQATAIIMGSEESGISRSNIDLCDDMVKIPIQGKIQSLNVSAASAVLFFEVVKQRMK